MRIFAFILPAVLAQPLQTLRHWRHKPWVVTVGAPPRTTITVPQCQALLDQLGAAIPTVISNCRSNPDRLYGDYLPAPIKGLMVGLAEQVEGGE